MNRIEVNNLDDQRIAAYRALRDRELAREGEKFIAEGELVVRRLMASDFPVESVLLAQRRAAEIGPIVPKGVPVYVVGDDLIHRVIGFRFHSGVIACGRRKPALTLGQILPPAPRPVLVVVLPETAGPDNLGSLVRMAAGFGADAVILGERCADAFYRRTIRVSMGAVFGVPIYRSASLLSDLGRLRADHGIELAATVLDEDAQPLATVRRAARFGLLFGNEAQGLDRRLVDACGCRVTIPMSGGTDSLNVAMAAGIVMYHFAQGEGKA
jgi:tRNA G18 (ribose-2'-O)-methylase SpoU